MQKIKTLLKIVGGLFLVILTLLIILAFTLDEETTSEVTEQASLGAYVVDGDDSLFDGYSDARVEIWASEVPDTLSDSRELITKLERGTEVELLKRSDDKWYCQVRNDSVVGWLACEWLKQP